MHNINRYTSSWCRCALDVVDHFHAGAVIAAFLVKCLLLLAAVEDGLVAAGVVGDGVEGVHEQAAEASALVLLGDANLLDMADSAAVMNTGPIVNILRKSSARIITYNFFSARTKPVPTIRPSYSMTR